VIAQAAVIGEAVIGQDLVAAPDGDDPPEPESGT
jgi:hypothetical protein